MSQANAAVTTGRALTRADLNVHVNHEPRIADLRLAEALGFDRPRNIRRLVERHRAALERFGEVCSTVEQTSGRGGRPGRAFFLNKRQALFLCTKSETERATEITIEIVEVYDEHRGDAPALPAPIAVREHKRRPPRRKALALSAPPAPMARPFEPGSDFVRDMRSAVLSALVRVQNGQTASFGDALKEVFDDLVGIKDCGQSLSKKPLFDWNALRAERKAG